MQHASPQAAARRRANFTGGVDIGNINHDGSYQHLRAELGEENTNRLITNIGTLAMSSGLSASGMSLSDAVKRIIGSLTPAERSAIASGGAPPPRVQALLDSEIKAAQQQRQTQLANANVTGADGLPTHRSGVFPGAFAAMDRDLRGRETRSREYSDLRSDSISSVNYSSSAFARTGLNYATFSDLRKQGFDAPQIMAAVKETKSLGIDTNRNAAPMARVQRDIPSAVPGLHKTRDNWTEVKKLEEEQRKTLEAGNAAAAEAMAAAISEARKHAEEHDKKERERVQQLRPDRAQDHQRLQDEVRRAALGHEARAGVANDARVSDASAVVPRANGTAIKAEASVLQAAAASEAAVERTRTNLASRFGAAPEQPQPQQRAEAPAATPAAVQPAAASVKTEEATAPAARQPTLPPRMG